MTSQSTNSSDDREILERFKAREPGVFASLFRAYYAQLVAIAWTMRGRGRSYAIVTVVLAAAGAVAVVHAIWALARS